MEKFLKKWNIIYEVIVLGGRPLHKKEPEDAELKQKMDKAKKLSVVFNIIVYLAIPFFLTTIIMREIDFNHIIYMLIASTIWCILSKLFLEYEVKYINSLLKQMGDKIVVIEEP